MKRQITKASDTQTRGIGAEGEVDNYLDRLLKLIPAETIAMYLFLEGLLATALANDTGQLRTWLWIVAGVLALGNILYLRQYQSVTDPLQLLFLTIAFFVWLMTIGGPFEYIQGYQPFMGSVVLGLFTFFVPLFYKGKPVEG
jgi:hypothetical protein